MTATPVPEWLTADLFVSVLEKNVENFDKINKFTADTPFTAGENFLSILWAIQIEAALKDGSTKICKYMLKIPPTSAQAQAMIGMMNSFKRERICYYELFPVFDEMYRKAGKVTKIAPNAYSFDKDLGFDVILMEDVRQEGFKNMNRLEGLDMDHAKSALEVLAEFHAASATYIVNNNGLPSLMMAPMLKDGMVEMLAKSQEPQEQVLVECLPIYKAEYLREKLISYRPKYLKEILNSENRSMDDFNVLSHGDCWSNNIMFQHDDKSNVLNTLLVDFQVGRFTSPALDLQYFLLSSTSLDIKLKYYDYFIQYYHQKLIENLKLLGYSKKMPSLRDLHMWMYDYSFMGYTVLLKSLPVILLDPKATKDINMDNMMGDKNDGGAMQKAMYTGVGYCKQMQQLLPWLANKGYFD
uniref:CHK domain-containing protein n=1 Tax=Musca domestica TaxID=7370 RepID=A0A1I8MRV5_MUSDO